MTEVEKALFTKTERKSDKIEVPIANVRLDVNEVLNLRSVDAKDSGKLCGPKAANLGQLKKMFPEKVVEGLVIPFGISEFSEVDWNTMPLPTLYRVGFIIIFTSFMTYMFNLFAIKELKPTTLSIFIYLQPVIASSYALFVGSDSLNVIKVAATVLIFIGVYLVTRKPKETLN